MRAAVVVASLLTGLAGCAPSGSFVQGIAPGDDAAAVSQALTRLVAGRIGAPNGPVALVPPRDDQAGNPVTPKLSAALEAEQYKLVPGEQSARQVRYLVAPFASGVLIRVQVDGQTSAQMLGRQAAGGALAPVAPVVASVAEVNP